MIAFAGNIIRVSELVVAPVGSGGGLSSSGSGLSVEPAAARPVLWCQTETDSDFDS